MDENFTDEEFLRYCETPRAGFVPEHLARLHRLAGKEQLAKVWDGQGHGIFSFGAHVVHPLVAEARARLRRKTFKVVA